MDAALAPKAESALSITPHPDIWCRYCGHTGTQVEVHMELVEKPMGTWSLAGAQPKTVVVERPWMFMRCLGCDHVSRGQYEEPDAPSAVVALSDEDNARLNCGDWPAPCNCDDPKTHGGH